MCRQIYSVRKQGNQEILLVTLIVDRPKNVAFFSPRFYGIISNNSNSTAVIHREYCDNTLVLALFQQQCRASAALVVVRCYQYIYIY